MVQVVFPTYLLLYYHLIKTYSMSWQSLEERFIQTEELYDCKTLIKNKKIKNKN